MILFGEEMLRRALREYLEHYHRERQHQGLGNVNHPGISVFGDPGVVQSALGDFLVP